MNKKSSVSRRQFISTVGKSAAVSAVAAPFIHCGQGRFRQVMQRDFGRIPFSVTTMGLGGQASIQWTPADVDPVSIILKAYETGINYFDTSNLYGPSQINYGKAFRRLGLVPGIAGYQEKKRRSIFLTTKTALRWGKGGEEIEGVRNWSNGPKGSHAVDDLKRTLSQVFGDGKGNYADDAYVDMILIHTLTSMPEVDVLYRGLRDTRPDTESIGALAALRDYRDGTNLTGLNPKEEKRLRHIGFSGHYSPAVMMEMIQRDEENLIDGMLVAINANDKLYFNMQHNVIPVAKAKNMGVIAMKVFADGAMYSKGSHWSRNPEHVVRTVGSPQLPFKPLIRYALTTPGIDNAIIGIGQISDDPQQCQLQQNLAAAQVDADALTPADRKEIEALTAGVKEGNTNYFQMEKQPLTPPQNAMIAKTRRDGKAVVNLTWNTAFAGDAPLQSYEIYRNNEKIDAIEHQPQTSKKPFQYEDTVGQAGKHHYRIVTVDAKNRRAESEELAIVTGIS